MPQFDQRRDHLRTLVRQANVEACLITNPQNVSYLTGFTGDDSYLLLTLCDGIILSDPRYTTQLEAECPDLELVIRRPGKPILESVVRTLKSARIAQLALEGSSLSAESFQRLGQALPRVQRVLTSGLVEQLREIKDKEEVAKIRQAVHCAQRAFAVVKASLRGSATEKDIADQLEHQIRLFGGQCSSFPPIVAVGARAALPHARPGSTRVRDSNLLLVDWGAQMDFYFSDLTRLIVTGKVSSRLRRIYEIVLAAQRKAIDMIKPGAIMEDIDAAARSIISQAGYGRRFGHSVGHGIGLSIHEQPRLAVDQKRPLLAGMVVTVEPGIYLPGWGGVRIEDDVLVTRGSCEVLSDCPKDFSALIVTLPTASS